MEVSGGTRLSFEQLPKSFRKGGSKFVVTPTLLRFHWVALGIYFGFRFGHFLGPILERNLRKRNWFILGTLELPGLHFEPPEAPGLHFGAPDAPELHFKLPKAPGLHFGRSESSRVPFRASRNSRAPFIVPGGSRKWGFQSFI